MTWQRNASRLWYVDMLVPVGAFGQASRAAVVKLVVAKSKLAEFSQNSCCVIFGNYFWFEESLIGLAGRQFHPPWSMTSQPLMGFPGSFPILFRTPLVAVIILRYPSDTPVVPQLLPSWDQSSDATNDATEIFAKFNPCPTRSGSHKSLSFVNLPSFPARSILHLIVVQRLLEYKRGVNQPTIRTSSRCFPHYHNEFDHTLLYFC